MEKKNKTVVLSYDGMSVKSELSYNAKADKFYGFPDHGVKKHIEKNDTMKLATEAVTVMVSGIYQRFKQVGILSILMSQQLICYLIDRLLSTE